jgi:hypothetical protein
MPQGEEADPFFVYTTVPFGGGEGVMIGDLKVSQSDDPLDRRVLISFRASCPDSLDLSDGFLRDLSILLLHRSRVRDFDRVDHSAAWWDAHVDPEDRLG